MSRSRRTLLSFALLPVLMGLAPLSPASAEGGATLAGYVFRTQGSGGGQLFVLPSAASPAGSLPAAGASVSASGALGFAVTGTADGDGRFWLEVPGGRYVFLASLPGYAPVGASVSVAPGTTAAVSAGSPAGTLFVTGASGISPTQFDVYFSRPLDTSASTGTYTLRPALPVLGASSVGSGRVRLTTAPQVAGNIYVVTAAGVKGTDGELLHPAHRSAPFPGIGSAPQVAGAESVDPTHVDVFFSAPMLAESAGLPGRYSFSPHLDVLSAAVLDGGKRVRLITSEQRTGAGYTVYANGIQAASGSSLDYAHATAPFVGRGLAPRVVSASSADPMHVEVRFDEEVDPYSAAQVGSYLIPGVQVVGAWMTGDARVVRLETTEQTAGGAHRVLVSGVSDRAGNVIGSAYNAAGFTGQGVPPTVSYAAAVDSYQVDVVFNEPLGPLPPLGVQAGFAPALDVKGISLLADGRTLRVRTAEQTDGQAYTVTLIGVCDRAGNTVSPPGVSTPFTGIGTPPPVLAAWAVDTTHVDVRFGEPLQSAGTYSIDPYVNVTGAALQPDGVTVRLTTDEMATGTTYTVYVSDALDPAGNSVDPARNTATFGGAGGAPQVASAVAVESTTVEVLFNEGVDPATAETLGSYTFAPTLVASFAQLQGDGRTVRLTTSEQTGGAAYEVTVTGVQDTAGNAIGAVNNKASFSGIGEAPTLTSAVAADSTTVEVHFSEAMHPGAASMTANYTLSPPLPITGADLQPDGLTVILTTDEQTNGLSYTVTAQNVADVAGNPIGATGNSAPFTGIGVAPRVVSATAVDSTTVDVAFDEALDAATANVPANFALTPALSVTTAALQGDGMTVRLTTTEQRDGESYTITACGVNDLASNVVAAPDDSASFTGIGVAPQVVSASAVDGAVVDVVFSEAVDAATAEGPTGYTISPTLAVFSATLQPDGQTVRLTTDFQTPEMGYTVTVTGVTDLAGNPVDAGANTAAFPGLSPVSLSGITIDQVGGVAGSNLGTYRYLVTYFSLLETPPVSVDLTIRDPGGAEMGVFAMKKVNDDDDTYADGCQYTFRSSVLIGGAGLFTCQVDASDEAFAAAPQTAVGPTVTVVDGSRILFRSDASGNPEMYSVDTSGGAPLPLTATGNTALNMGATVSPDGRHLVASMDHDEQSPYLYLVKTDGSGVVGRLTSNTYAEAWPSWSPDGSKIAYESASVQGEEIYIIDASGGNPQSLTNNGTFDSQPTWSPDGSRIAFVSARDGNHEIYTMHADGGNVVRLTNDLSLDQHPQWSPDGTKIAFQSNRIEGTDVWVMDANGSNQQPLTSDGTAGEPCWSPDGSKIAFRSWAGETGGIQVMNADGTGRTPLAATEGTEVTPRWAVPAAAPSPFSAQASSDAVILLADGAATAAVSVTVRDGSYQPIQGVAVNFSTNLGSIEPSATTDVDGTAEATFTAGTTAGAATVTVSVSGGKNPTANTTVELVPEGRIAFQTGRDGDYEIYAMNSDGTGLTRLTNSAGEDLAPCYSPDGQRIAFESCRDENYEIYVMDADGGNPTRLTDNPASDFAPAWSPDGSKIAFQSDRSGNDEVYVMNADGTGVRALTHSDSADTRPSWSPDGRRIAFQSDRDGHDEIYVVNLDGGGLTRLTSYPSGNQREPSWSPDGSRIAFHSDRDGQEFPDVYVMNADGSNQTRVTTHFSNDWSVRWSPDGSYLVYHSYDAGDGIYVMRPDGTGRTFLTSNDDPHSLPSWGPLPQAPSPYSVSLVPDKRIVTADGTSTCEITVTVRDGGYQPVVGATVDFSTDTGALSASNATTATGGTCAVTLTAPNTPGVATVAATVAAGRNPTGSTKVSFVSQGKIAFTSGRDSNFEIYVMDADGGNPTRLTDDAAPDTSPSWSPDGAKIAFTSERDGNPEIYVVDADGGNLVRLTSVSSPDGMPAWSPDGSKIAFVRNTDIYVMNPDGTDLTRLTTATGMDTCPVWSPDGSKIAFASERDGNREIYVMDADGSNQTRLTENTSYDDEPAWSPDGSKIAFDATRDGNWEIYVMDADGGKPMRLTTDGLMDTHASWSPDGSKITFASFRNDNGEVFVMDADGSNQASLTSNPPLGNLEPVWSSGLGEGAYRALLAAGTPVIAADGSSTVEVTAKVLGGHAEPRAGETVAFVTDKGTLSNSTGTTDANGEATVTLTSSTSIGPARVTATVSGPRGEVVASADVRLAGPGKIAFHSDRGGDFDIYVMDPDGGNQTRITTDGGHDTGPAWSPDGTRIAFSTNRDGNQEIYVMSFDGTEEMRLTSHTASDWHPTWSPDGTRIAFQTNRDGTYQIYVMNADGSGAVNVSSNSYDDEAPDWSPDGSKIAFHSNRDGNGEIYVMNADGGSQVRLTNNSTDDVSPAWSPDGSRIAFRSSRDGDYQVYVTNADGSNQTRLASASSDEVPVWSPDGSKIAYTSGGQVFVMNADGSGRTKLTTQGTNNACPSWSRGTDPQTGRAPVKPAPRTRTQNARLRAYCNGQEAFALLTPLGVVPEGRGDGLFTPGDPGARDQGPGTRDRAPGSRRDPMEGTPEAAQGEHAGSPLRFVPLTEGRSAPSTPPHSHTSTLREWLFALEAPDAGADITLSWPDLSGLGAKDRVMIEDLDGGKRRSMRTQAAYTFRVGEEKSRRFRVTAEKKQGPAVLITGLQLVGVDGGVRSPGSGLRLVRFDLSTEAAVDIRLMAPTGREVAMLTRQFQATAGLNQVSWRGALAAGVYLMEATASTEDGSVVKTVQPVVVVR